VVGHHLATFARCIGLNHKSRVVVVHITICIEPAACAAQFSSVSITTVVCVVCTEPAAHAARICTLFIRRIGVGMEAVRGECVVSTAIHESMSRVKARGNTTVCTTRNNCALQRCIPYGSLREEERQSEQTAGGYVVHAGEVRCVYDPTERHSNGATNTVCVCASVMRARLSEGVGRWEGRYDKHGVSRDGMRARLNEGMEGEV
jgi:hypothetical protein